jgi:hypothetical protein
MKNFKAIIIVAILCLCGTGAQAQSLKDLISGVAKTVVGNKATSESSIVGTWKYSGPACEFDSDNLLSKAGGTVATTKINNTLSPILKKAGLSNLTFTINSDGTYTSKIKKYTTSGTYTFDSSAKTITFKTSTGRSYTVNVVVTGSSMEMLVKANKLMDMLKTISSSASSLSSSVSVINTLLKNYNGMKVGFTLKK